MILREVPWPRSRPPVTVEQWPTVPINVLFVCTTNLVRSPMAARLLDEVTGRRCVGRSAGLAREAPRRVTTRELAWAHVVVVMERWHEQEIRRYWPRHAGKVRVFGIPDAYDRGDGELDALLTDKIRALVGGLGGRA